MPRSRVRALATEEGQRSCLSAASRSACPPELLTTKYRWRHGPAWRQRGRAGREFNLFNGGSDRAKWYASLRSAWNRQDLRDKSCRDISADRLIAYNDVRSVWLSKFWRSEPALSISGVREAYRKQFDIGQRTLPGLCLTPKTNTSARRAYVNGDYDHKVAERARWAAWQPCPVCRSRVKTLPALSDLAKDREAVALSAACPAEAPGPAPC